MPNTSKYNSHSVSSVDSDKEFLFTANNLSYLSLEEVAEWSVAVANMPLLASLDGATDVLLGFFHGLLHGVTVGKQSGYGRGECASGAMQIVACALGRTEAESGIG